MFQWVLVFFLSNKLLLPGFWWVWGGFWCFSFFFFCDSFHGTAQLSVGCFQERTSVEESCPFCGGTIQFHWWDSEGLVSLLNLITLEDTISWSNKVFKILIAFQVLKFIEINRRFSTSRQIKPRETWSKFTRFQQQVGLSLSSRLDSLDSSSLSVPPFQ